MNKSILIYLSIFIIFLCGCKNKEPIVIGFSANLTGRQSELGVTGRNGVEIAVEEINAVGGINGRLIKLIVKDDKNNPEEALKVDKEIIQEGGIAIIGHLLSGMIKDIIPYSNQNKVLYISPTISTNKLNNIDDYFIRIIASNKNQGELIAEEMIRQNIKTVTVLFEEQNKAYSEELFSYFEKKFIVSGGKVIFSRSFKSGKETDFYDLAEDIVKSKPEAVLSIASGMDNALLCQNLNKLNSSLPVFASLWSMTSDLITYGGKAVDRINISGVFNINSNNPSYIKFKSKYLERYNVQPTFSSIFSYEAAMVLFESLKKTSGFSPDEIKKNILAIRKYNGLQEDFEINNFGDTERPYHIVIVRNKQFIAKY